MAKTIGVHEMAFESFQRLMENMHVRQQAYAFPTWKLSAGRVLEFLVWTFKRVLEKGAVTVHDLGEFRPATLPQDCHTVLPGEVMGLLARPPHWTIISFSPRSALKSSCLPER